MSMQSRSAARRILTKNDYAYAELRDRIISGELPSGLAIPQAQIAEEIGVSTTPLREAVRRLAAEGFIHLTAHRDARVVEATADEARHLYEVRESVDPLAASLAAEHRTAADIERIQAAEQTMRPLDGNANIESLQAHREFHRSIYEASKNPLLIDILERLWDKADRYRLIGLRDRGDSSDDTARVAAEHQEIAEAVIDGDAQRAAAAMRGHIAGSLGRRAIVALEGTAPTAI